MTHGHKKRPMGLKSGHGHHFSMGLGMGTQKNSRAHLYLFVTIAVFYSSSLAYPESDGMITPNNLLSVRCK